MIFRNRVAKCVPKIGGILHSASPEMIDIRMRSPASGGVHGLLSKLMLSSRSNQPILATCIHLQPLTVNDQVLDGIGTSPFMPKTRGKSGS